MDRDKIETSSASVEELSRLMAEAMERVEGDRDRQGDKGDDVVEHRADGSTAGARMHGSPTNRSMPQWPQGKWKTDSVWHMSVEAGR